MTSYAKALNHANEAVRLDGEGKYVDAEAQYNTVIYYLRETIRDPDLPQDQRAGIMNYMSDIAKRLQALRIVNSQSSSSASPSASASPSPRPAPATSAPLPVPLKKEESDYLAFLDTSALTGEAKPSSSASAPAPKKQNPPSKPATPPPAAPTPPPAPLASATSNTNSNPAAALPPPSAAFKNIDIDRTKGLSEHFAPRTSDLVFKAIDVAIQLNKQGQYKRAVDVLSHAYAKGVRERHNPSNFGDIAETLKEMRQRYYKQNPPRFLQDNPILPEEIAVLRKSGITNTILLPIWDDVKEGYGAENIFMPSEGIWEDSFTPQLCPRQKTEGAAMTHIKDLAPLGTSEPGYFRIINQADPMNVRQTVVGDCSMVSSLIICASYQKRFPQAKIISNVIYPQDDDRNPIVNPKGKYCVKMLINGITRMVTIDDRLPANPRSRKLLCTLSKDPTELWVSLMEKAFVKFCGGTYDFPGSTSASDLYKLSGWLPDSITFGSKSFSSAFHWKRLLKNFASGGVLLTISTGNMSTKDESSLGLSGGHAYAVLDMQEVAVEGEGVKRVLLVRNPWSKPTWSGALSWGSAGKSKAAAAVHAAMQLTQDLHDNGVFCISWEDVTTIFDRCSLSWNPYLLYRTPEGGPRKPLRLACHGTFNYSTSMGGLPQAHICVRNAPRSTRMHLVLSRHVTDVAEFGRQHDKDDKRTPFLALRVYDVTEYPSLAQHLGGRCQFGMCYARRLTTASDLETRLQPLNEVVYRNMAAQTISFDCPSGSSDLVVVVARTEDCATDTFSFSLTLHTELEQLALPFPSGSANDKTGTSDNNSRLEGANATAGNTDSGVFMHLVPMTCLKNTKAIEGSWVKGKTCGGRGDDSTFVYNPQYTLTLRKPARVCLRLMTAHCNQPAQLYLMRKSVISDAGVQEQLRKMPFAARIGNANSDSDFIMQAKLFGYGGAMVDSALPDTLSYDRYRILGDKQQVKLSKKLKVRTVSGNAANANAEEFTIYDVDDDDEVTTILLAALLKAYPVSPTGAAVVVEGKRVAPTEKLSRIFALSDPLHDEDLPPVAHSVTAARGVRVQLLLADDTFVFVNDIQKRAGDAKAQKKSDFLDLYDQLRDVATSIAQRSSQFSSFMPSLAFIATEAKSAARTLSPVQSSFLAQWAELLASYAQRLSSAPRKPPAPRPPLAPLPAGTYTVIPALWEKGVPGNYSISIEATEAFDVAELPEEGSGLTQRIISGQILKNGAMLTGNEKLLPPLLVRKDSHYFNNSKVTISATTRCSLVCRALTIDAKPPAKTEKTYLNLSIFKAKDVMTMEMVAGSGLYSSGSASITLPSVQLEPQTTYIAVVSTSRPCDNEYKLFLYGDASYTAQLSSN